MLGRSLPAKPGFVIHHSFCLAFSRNTFSSYIDLPGSPSEPEIWTHKNSYKTGINPRQALFGRFPPKQEFFIFIVFCYYKVFRATLFSPKQPKSTKPPNVSASVVPKIFGSTVSSLLQGKQKSDSIVSKGAPFLPCCASFGC